jgi:hypothetical protein
MSEFPAARIGHLTWANAEPWRGGGGDVRSCVRSGPAGAHGGWAPAVGTPA